MIKTDTIAAIATAPGMGGIGIIRMSGPEAPEILMRVIKEGKKVLEMPVVMKERMRGRSSIRMKGSLYYMIKVTIAILLERIRKQ